MGHVGGWRQRRCRTTGEALGGLREGGGVGWARGCGQTNVLERAAGRTYPAPVQQVAQVAHVEQLTLDEVARTRVRRWKVQSWRGLLTWHLTTAIRGCGRGGSDRGELGGGVGRAVAASGEGNGSGR